MNSDALAARIENLMGSSRSSDAESFPSKPPPPIPNHEVIARIGGGSYGEVWLARSVTGAWRAVKVVWRSRFSSDRPYEREFRGIVQFEPISRAHPGVVNVLHVGRDDAAGCFFYVMELADDAVDHARKAEGERARIETRPDISATNYSPRTLASDLKSRRCLPVTEVVSLGVQLAGALGHLHRHGLVHRDVKPSNVIFVNGQAKLADIGLVTAVDEERSFVGTEGYIPPEGPGSERGDLFGLGRLLYEAAAGKNRCDFPGLPDDLDRWSKEEREALLELNEVLSRACAPEPKRRHGNAAELAGDLNLILAGRSVRRAYRVERRLRRASWISAAALVLVLITISSNWLQRRQREISDSHARREAALREEAQKSLARAEAAERQAQQQLYTALLEQARATVLSGEAGQRVRALDAIQRAAAISNSAELRREVFAALALPDLRLERELAFDTGNMPFHPDPFLERLAMARGKGPTEIRALSNNQLLASLPASTNLPVYHREWSDDGRFLAVKRDHPDGGVHADWEVWDVRKQERVLLLRRMLNQTFAFHPRLPQVIARSEAGGVAMWNLEDGREICRFPSVGPATVLRFSPDGERFAAVVPHAAGTLVAIHATDPGSKMLAASPVIGEVITAVTWHPSGTWLAVPDHGTSVRWMDAQSGETGLLGRHKLNAVRAVFSPEGDYLFTGGWEKELICWNARTKRREFTISRKSYTIQFAPDGRRCAVVTMDSMQLHHFERPAAHREFAEDVGGLLRHANFSPDGRWLAAAGDGHMGLWDLTTKAPGAITEEGANTILSFTSDARELFATRNPQASPDCFRWSITPAASSAAVPVLKRLPLHKPQGFTSLSLWSNSVVMSGARGTALVKISDLESPGALWKTTQSGINGISSDGRWLGVYRSYDKHLYVYRLPSLERVAKLPHPTSFGSFEFSPLGNEVAISSMRSAPLVEFWETTTWQRTRTLTNFGRALYTADARGLWLTQDQRTAGLYDARTLEPLLMLPTGMLPLALSSDGRHLAVSVDARRLQLWDLVELHRHLQQLGLEKTTNR